jgi:predicted aspartyl protease
MALSRLAAISIVVWASITTPGNAGTCKIEKNVEYPLVYANGVPALYAWAEQRYPKKMRHILKMGIDTGASTSVSPQMASGMQAAQDPYRRTRAIGTTGTILVENVQLRNFEFARKLYSTLSVPKIPLPPPLPSASISSPASGPLDGLIGGDLLSEYDIDLDLAGKSITFYNVRGCAHITPPWTEPYTSVAINVTSRHSIVLPVEVDGHKLAALLDTGATGYAITRRGALKSGATEVMLRADPTQEASGIGGIKKLPFHKFKTLAIGGETIPETALPVMDAELPDGDVLIGQPYLILRRVWISYSTRMLFIRAANTPSAQPPAVVAQPMPPLPILKGYNTQCSIKGLVVCFELPDSPPLAAAGPK